MKNHPHLRTPFALTVPAGLLLACTGALAHVTLPPGGATAGAAYEAAFHVGHACQGAEATTGITVRLPAGFVFTGAEPRTGWTLKTGARQVVWTAATPAAALPTKEHAEFLVRGTLPRQPGTLWFKVLQTCDQGSADWAQLPAVEGAAKPEFPAARLDVLAPGVAPVDVRDAWMRPAVPGQSGTGVFMKLAAPSGSRLVGITTSAADTAEVHEMKMDGDIMRMRPIVGGLVLPARKTVELTPGGSHVMLMGLKQPIVRGSTLTLTLRFADAQGRQGTREVQVPVGDPPAGSSGGMAGMADMPGMSGHKH
ncbi:MAG: copper chaperone PCu(A)C [Pseudomonadota bacterium]